MGILEMDFERIFEAPLFLSNSHSITKWFKDQTKVWNQLYSNYPVSFTTLYSDSKMVEHISLDLVQILNENKSSKWFIMSY